MAARIIRLIENLLLKSYMISCTRCCASSFHATRLILHDSTSYCNMEWINIRCVVDDEDSIMQIHVTVQEAEYSVLIEMTYLR